MKLEGHAAGGYLATRVLQHWLKPASAGERTGELALGIFAGILPDLDYIYYAIQKKGVKYDPDFRHHTWVSHTFPFYWIPSLLIYLAGRILNRRGLQRKAAVLAAAATAHLLQDTIGSGDGIMLLYPFSRRMDGIALSGLHGKEWKADYERKPVYWVERSITIAALLALTLDLVRRLRQPGRGREGGTAYG